MSFDKTYELNIPGVGRRSSITYRLSNSDLEVTVTLPDQSRAIQTLPMSENPDEIYRGFAGSVVGVTRIFVSRREVRDELTRTYQDFLEEYNASQSQQQPPENLS